MGSGISNPWLEIWVSPKRTIRTLLGTDSQKSIIWLAIIAGVLSTFSWIGYVYQKEFLLHQIGTFLILLVGGGLLGLIYLYFGGWLYRLTGGWLGGTGCFREVKCAVGWSFYPAILAHIASLLSIWAVPNPWLQALFGLITIVLAVWAFVIFLNLIGEAHRFSAWRAFLAYLITLILVFVVIMLISLLIPLLAPLFY